MLKPTINKLLNGLLPRQCILCDMRSNNSTNVCHSCQNRLPRIETPCHHCGIDMRTSSNTMLCAPCIKAASHYDRCVALYRYETSARTLVTKFKFEAKFAAGQFLAEQLSASINAHYRDKKPPNAILAIPLHSTRLLGRGYNQSLILAQRVAHTTQIPLISHGLCKPRATPAQTSLNSASARTRNLLNSFAVNSKIREQELESVIIIDDVVTTGATLNEAAKTLLLGGVKKVVCFCVARAN